MAVSGHLRKERVHTTGASNRAGTWMPQDGPLDFDASMRSTMPAKMSYKVDLQVPTMQSGSGNQDFSPKLPGHDYRQPRSDPRETTRLRRMTATQLALDMTVPVLSATQKDGTLAADKPRATKQRGQKPAPRWNPKHWHEAPHYEQAPLQKDEGMTWNSLESAKVQGEIKGQDRLFRTVRRPEDVATPNSDAPGRRHPLNQPDKDEYYPGRSLIDAVGEEPGNDFQVRPVNLPDFYNPPPVDADSKSRMTRLREVVRQRYAGRPRLIGVFRACALQKPGYVFPKDLKQVFDQMGIKVSIPECEMLVQAVDKDTKGAATFEEFADLIYGPRVTIGGKPHEPQERHVRHVTKTLVDSLLTSGQTLGQAFCELDPERRYEISKQQFANALGTACNHISSQAVEFLWASQFPAEKEGVSLDNKSMDWRSFMSQLAHFSHDNRAPTPSFLQGRKRQYDLLQRTAPLTGGVLEDVDLNRPDQNADDEVCIVADHLVHRAQDLASKPRDAALLTEHYVEGLRAKATRVERALPQRVSKARMQQLLKYRETVHQDELIDMILHEIEEPATQGSLSHQEPLYASMPGVHHGSADVMTLDGKSPVKASKSQMEEPPIRAANSNGYPPPACLKVVRGDVEAFVATQMHNRDHEVDVSKFLEGVYRPPEYKKQIEYVNDGLNRALRGNRPPRERAPDEEAPRYQNYWQARYMMEAIGDAIATVETASGGKVKPSKMFKRMDIDNDGYLSLSDLRTTCEKFKVPHTSADLHAIFSELDKFDKGSVDIGEFTRNYEVHQGNLMDNMQKPIKQVYHEGGVEYGGFVQDQLDARDKALQEREQLRATVARSSSVPGSPSGLSAQGPPGTGSVRSNMSAMSRTGGYITSGGPIYDTQVGYLTGKARVSDVIRARTNAWKPDKSELYTSVGKTRYGMTVYPDTRHITEPTVPNCSCSMGDSERFKTTNNVNSLFATPDSSYPQAADTMKKHARQEFRVERIKNRQRDFAERCWAANEAAQQFDEMKVARKALNLLNYERKCHMASA
eukprot:CAMPEP_0115164636 /NCGR_PEP_ID=MMETSP0227-20121206/73140_1 /TAXON_ID=89957 /ORGANISM="Polarella glacialis, Strain CCMP 1383" /LENGTH=1027 /DNA_ID=CAMNT_0002577005 /DNA_START=24 /DNA_END=3107 /DNA_ORIENTATION=-